MQDGQDERIGLDFRIPLVFAEMTSGGVFVLG